MKRIAVVQWYLGDECYLEKVFNLDGETDWYWLSHFENDTRRGSHPQAKLVIRYYELTKEITARPTNPLPLEEVVG